MPPNLYYERCAKVEPAEYIHIVSLMYEKLPDFLSRMWPLRPTLNDCHDTTIK